MVRERAKVEPPVPNFGKSETACCKYERSVSPPCVLVLATGERTEAVSGCQLFFSLSELPHHFEFSWPMQLLPIELSPLNAPFLVNSALASSRPPSG